MVQPRVRLIEDAPAEALDFIVIFLFNAVFVALAALVLWAAGMTPLAVRLTKAYAVLWGAAAFTHTALAMLQSFLRVNIYDHHDLYVYSNITAGLLLLPAWVAYAALEARAFAEGRTFWTAALVYFGGFLASFVAWKAVCVFYRGYIYQAVFLPVALVGFVLFALWPAAGRTLYGWLFDLF